MIDRSPVGIFQREIPGVKSKSVVILGEDRDVMIGPNYVRGLHPDEGLDIFEGLVDMQDAKAFTTVLPQGTHGFDFNTDLRIWSFPSPEAINKTMEDILEVDPEERFLAFAHTDFQNSGSIDVNGGGKIGRSPIPYYWNQLDQGSHPMSIQPSSEGGLFVHDRESTHARFVVAADPGMKPGLQNKMQKDSKEDLIDWYDRGTSYGSLAVSGLIYLLDTGFTPEDITRDSLVGSFDEMGYGKEIIDRALDFISELYMVKRIAPIRKRKIELARIAAAQRFARHIGQLRSASLSH